MINQWYKYVSALSLLGTFILAVIFFTRFLDNITTNHVVLSGDVDRDVAVLTIQLQELKQRAVNHERQCDDERKHIRTELSEVRQLIQQVLLRLPAPRPTSLQHDMSLIHESKPKRMFYFEQRKWPRYGTAHNTETITDFLLRIEKT